MPGTDLQRKTIAPTLVIGVGGTGLEVISRLRRLVVESYGTLDNLPVLSFLHIDTDNQYKVQQTSMAGPELKDFEKYWATVSYEEASQIVDNLSRFPYYQDWLPTELVSDTTLLASVEGAKQIRACGRFAFFFNHDGIRQATESAKRRTDFHKDFIANEYGLQVANKLNIFVVASISGGTGSGMLIDLGYCLRRWFSGQEIETTAIIPSPDAFSSAGDKSRVKENGYAALMELNYFSDSRTKFLSAYERDDQMPGAIADRTPYDFTYFIGTSNGSRVQLDINDVREMCAQNIFLDLVSNFSSYKRSLRDNFKGFAAQLDQSPEGQAYPRNFMSFGLATIEIPLPTIYSFIGHRLAGDLYKWWLNTDSQLPPEPREEIQNELKDMKLIGGALLKAVSLAGDRQLTSQASQRISDLDAEIAELKLLQCKAQMPNPLAKETGNILGLVDYIQPKVEEYKAVKFSDTSPEERRHGDFLQKMYENRSELVSQGILKIEQKLYDYLEDRTRGPKFVQAMLDYMGDIFTSEISRFQREADQTWIVSEQAGQKRYDKAIGEISQSASQWMIRKQDKIKKAYDQALSGLRLSWASRLEYKSRQIAIEVLKELQKTVDVLKNRLNRWLQRVESSSERLLEMSEGDVERITTMKIVGLNLFENSRERVYDLYTDFINSYQGIEILAPQMTEQILDQAGSLQRNSMISSSRFRLFDIEKTDGVIDYPKFRKFVLDTAASFIVSASEQSKIKSNLDACLALMEQYPKDSEREAQIKILAEKSQPLVVLSRVIPGLSDPQFTYQRVSLVGLLGGDNTQYEPAQQQVAYLRQNFGQIATLTPRERHKIIAVHEVGGFSLRCIEGIKQLRQAYQKWRGQRFKSEREALENQNRKREVTVHMQENFSQFWDLSPASPDITKLVVLSRALEVLRGEIYSYSGRSAVCYNKDVQGDLETIVLAENWEEAIQILDLSVASSDKQEIEEQLQTILEDAQTLSQKQSLSRKLRVYLDERENYFHREGGTTNPVYKQESRIIKDFLQENNLPKLPSGGEQNPSDLHEAQRGIGFEVTESERTSFPDTSDQSTTNFADTGIDSQTKVCSHCGHINGLSDNFCSNCGHSF